MLHEILMVMVLSSCFVACFVAALHGNSAKALGGGYKTDFDSSVYLGAPMDQDFRAALAASSANDS